MNTKLEQLKVLIIGSLNIDFVGLNIPKFLNPGELSYGGELFIGPGGKSRNIAQMVSFLIGKNKVAILGLLSDDPLGLWKIPLKALKDAGVITDYIKILKFKKVNKFPGSALIIVDKNGKNQIYVLPGVNELFDEKYIEEMEFLFKKISQNRGLLILTFEAPLNVIKLSIEKGIKYGIRIFIDPGGIEKGRGFEDIIKKGIYFLKPNEFEAEILTGIQIKDFNSAKKSAKILLKKGIENILITHGEKGGYYFNQKCSLHIDIPIIKNIGSIKDATGCGDQVSATICAKLLEGKNEIESCKYGILAGTLQFYKKGIKPVSNYELNKYII